MLPNFILKRKSFWGFFNSILDCFYPPLCIHCNERTDLISLCSQCWQLSQLPDPVLHCKYCFDLLTDEQSLCAQCKQKPLLPVRRAFVFDKGAPAHLLGMHQAEGLAGFAVFQWIQLEWPFPDAVIPMPDTSSKKIGRAFADLLNVPFIQALKPSYAYVEERLEEDQALLIFDVRNDWEFLHKCATSLSEAFPKKMYVLTLFPKI
ncbi:MAG: hypothetical protein ACD_17C00218G0002 [uncultured bacterium]|nr:MAG: hypothetical protein ACD_17C00218G0002 [uncultured bacterium]OGN56796.1 MAG: hypothetical protein A2796_06285 [Chlamydiae bacterium RIFCSPHIGHO2_01_FULL_44_39]OGN58402.1 MAG: hypothetical protein A3C42_00445 [Chlamydiae bacterium RIFCSPHIGHO2_02_FULL_45_9]OGN59480.1 MAG: hypothetical protein A3D96_07275 [Chlamydiae bacterium RIFCSPHIGHO2_12_FULL_44_59]OGN67233.1 MAG: hypothetical protein A2978_03660 [Chlamydiae bacterium RIFCSPLOWO2_01_FULL_44_52]OGN67430.1 MAG: hypothetical protein A3